MVYIIYKKKNAMVVNFKIPFTSVSILSIQILKREIVHYFINVYNAKFIEFVTNTPTITYHHHIH